MRAAVFLLDTRGVWGVELLRVIADLDDDRALERVLGRLWPPVLVHALLARAARSGIASLWEALRVEAIEQAADAWRARREAWLDRAAAEGRDFLALFERYAGIGGAA